MKLSFRIEIKYMTGNSFGSQEETDTVGHVFDTAEDAADAAVRIWDHKKFYDSHNSWSSREPKLDPRDERWYYEGDRKDEWQYTLVLKDGSKIGTFWLGYFESLQDLTIRVDRDDRA